MALTSREKIALLLAIAAVAILVADRYVLTPLAAKRTENKQLCSSMQAELEQSLSIMNRRKLLQVRWKEMLQGGLTDRPGQAESLVLRFLQESSKEAGLLLTSLQPEHSPAENQFGQIEFFISGSGSMRAVTRFLWHVETASLPLRVKTFQLGGNDENASQMSLQLTLSSIYIAEEEQGEQENVI